MSQTSNKGGKKCVFCRSSSHLQPSCPKIIIFRTSLKNDNGPTKDALISDLYTINRSVAIRNDTDNRIVMNIVPKPVRGVVIYQRLLANNRLINVYLLNNLSLECTFILFGGEERPLYRRNLFKIGPVVVFISTCRTNIIISQL